MKRATLALVLVALSAASSSRAAEPTRAGVVTTLLGSATIVRTNAPEPAPLKFRDPVFLHDRITTGQDSMARILLGGKALVTVRERSVLHVTEVPGTSTVELTDGRIALTVVKDRMKPGETLEIRTPNAVAGIRGTIAIAEYARGISTFVVLRGRIEVASFDPGTRQVVGPRVPVGINERVNVRQNAPIAPPQQLNPDAVRRIGGDYHVGGGSEARTIDGASAPGGPGPGGPGTSGPGKGGPERGPSGPGGPPSLGGDVGGRGPGPKPVMGPILAPPQPIVTPDDRRGPERREPERLDHPRRGRSGRDK